MPFLNAVNPFSRREEYSTQAVTVFKITTFLSYLILLVSAFYYTFNAPHEGHKPHRTIWGQNIATPFAQNSIITSIYWYVP